MIPEITRTANGNAKVIVAETRTANGNTPAFLALGAAVAATVGPAILDWYLSLL